MKTTVISKTENLKQVDMLSKLQPGWDANSGMSFGADAIATFRRVLNNLSVQPLIAPTGRSSIFMRFSAELFVELFAQNANILWSGMVETVPAEDAADYINRILSSHDDAIEPTQIGIAQTD